LGILPGKMRQSFNNVINFLWSTINKQRKRKTKLKITLPVEDFV